MKSMSILTIWQINGVTKVNRIKNRAWWEAVWVNQMTSSVKHNERQTYLHSSNFNNQWYP